MQEVKSDIQRAKDYLAQVFPIAHTPDRIKEELGLGSSAATIGRKLRSASVGDSPELIRAYYRNPKGKDIAIYAANKGYKAQETPVKATRTAPTWYFYTRRHTTIPSPYFHSITELKADRHYEDGFMIWQGSYTMPVLVEVGE